MAEDELEAQRAADKILQEQLRSQGFNSSDQSRKRGMTSDHFGDTSSTSDNFCSRT